MTVEITLSHEHARRLKLLQLGLGHSMEKLAAALLYRAIDRRFEEMMRTRQPSSPEKEEGDA